MALSDAELERYARHIVLREIGGPGQARLKAASVLVIGAGGLGSAALAYLAAAGVGRIAVVDDDAVSLSNLQRQVLHATGDVGRAKVESAVEALGRINPEVAVEPIAARATAATLPGLVAGRDLVLDGSDSWETRAAVNAACARAGVALVSGAIGQWEGQLSVFDPARGTACFACVFPEAPAAGLAPSCAEGGVLGALAGVFGALQAAEAVKAIAGAGEGLRGRMLMLDLLSVETRVVRLRRRAGCAVCGGGPAR